MTLRVFVPGVLRNPLNGSWGNWRKHAKAARTWREKTAMCVFGTVGRRRTSDSHQPKRITFCAQVGAPWDDDNLPAAIKPIRDGLVDARIIHADAPDSGHVFAYTQVVNRKERGVQITIEEVAG